MSRVERLRRAIAAAAGGAAALGGVEVVGLTHSHRWLAFAIIGLQVVLVVEALVLLARLKKVKAEQR
jgi:hypothetical protein